MKKHSDDWGKRMTAREAAQRAEPTQTEKAHATLAQLEAQQKKLIAEQAAAKQRQEELASTLNFLKQCEAAGQRAARHRRRDVRTARFGPYLFD